MQNPAFWARVGFFWCALVFGACWCASSANAATAAVVHAVPTLDGLGLFTLATLLGIAALWLWRHRQ